MTEDSRRSRQAQKWLARAELDITNARTIADSRTTQYDNVVFLAQQAAEKSLKAFLIQEGVDFPKIHDLSRLIDGFIAPLDAGLASELGGCRRLGAYAVDARYPHIETHFSYRTAIQMLALAVEAWQRISAAVEVSAPSPIAYVITTSRRTDPELTERAREWGERLGRPLVERGDRSLAQICEDEGVGAVLTVTAERVGLVFPADDVEYFFHPSMARTRIRNIKDGFGDPMVTAMALEPGDSVLDCTLGRATDAIVASWAVGEEGRVVGCEAVPLLAALTIHGLATYEIEGAGVQEAMRRIDARHGDCRAILPTLEADGFDVVYFDPFFEQMVERSPAMKPLRRIGLHEPIGDETYEEARRVARSRVVVKQRCGEQLANVPEPAEVISGGGSRVEYLVISPTC